MTFDAEALADYEAWHWAQVRTLDLDPVYPFLRAYRDVCRLDDQRAAALTLTYAAWYNMRSALFAWNEAGQAVPTAPSQYPTGVERRAHRSRAALLKHLASLKAHTGDDPHGWLTDAHDWRALDDRVQAVWGNGRWAGYKVCELAQKVHGAPITAPDAGHANSTGPRKALAMLGVVDPGGNSPAVLAYLDEQTAALGAIIGEPDVSQVETSLCDWRSHRNGHHPLGLDVNNLIDQVMDLPGAARALAEAGIRRVEAA